MRADRPANPASTPWVRRRAASVCVALGLASAGCTLVLDFSGDLIDAQPAPDGPLADADPLAPDGPPDPVTLFEPNNSRDGATPITPGSYGPAAIDPKGDKDFFKFTLAAPSDVTIDCLFVTKNGDLDLKLYDQTLTKLKESAGFADNEKIVCSAEQKCGALQNIGPLPAGDYFIEVLGFSDMRVNDSYQLVLTTVP
jgi:hypothetical protein